MACWTRNSLYSWPRQWNSRQITRNPGKRARAQKKRRLEETKTPASILQAAASTPGSGGQGNSPPAYGGKAGNLVSRFLWECLAFSAPESGPAEIIANEKHFNLEKNAVYGRFGNVGERKQGEIGIHAIRAGNISGEHTIIFNSTGERLELSHKAYSRDSFVHGTIKAIHFISNKKEKLFTMKEVLGL